LLVVGDGLPKDRRFADFPAWLRAGDVLVVNETRVVRARLRGRREPGGGAVELLLLRPADGGPFAYATRDWRALARPGRRLTAGVRIDFGDARGAEVVASEEGGVRVVRLDDGVDLAALMAAVGEVPLPPYVGPGDPARDARYQTVFARVPGSVAAPTASLHFTPAVLAAIRARGVTIVPLVLDVGLGTFRPIEAERVADHPMHAERYSIPAETAAAIARARAAGGRVVAAGTTAMRALESAAGEDGTVAAGDAETALYVKPLPVPRRRRAAHELPPAGLDAARPRRDVRRPRPRCRGVPRRDHARLSLLLFRRCDGRRARRPRLVAPDRRPRRSARRRDGAREGEADGRTRRSKGASQMEVMQPHRFTIEDYHAMGDAGILPRDRRVELMDGQVVEMSPIGRRHLAAVDRLNRMFVLACGTAAIVRTQGSILLPPFSEPQPDLLVLSEAPDFYAAAGARGRDVLLAVEVADSSLFYDMRLKATLYAREGIPELWIVDLRRDTLLVYRLVGEGRYGDPESLVDGRVLPERFPALSLDVAEILATAP